MDETGALDPRDRLIAQLRAEVERADTHAQDVERKLNEVARALADTETKLTDRTLDLARAREEAAATALHLASLQRDLGSASHRAVSAMQRRIRRLAPPGSARGRVIRALTWPLRASLRKAASP